MYYNKWGQNYYSSDIKTWQKQSNWKFHNSGYFLSRLHIIESKNQTDQPDEKSRVQLKVCKHL